MILHWGAYRECWIQTSKSKPELTRHVVLSILKSYRYIEVSYPMHSPIYLTAPRLFLAGFLILGMIGCSSIAGVRERSTCAAEEKTAMEQLNCEFKTMTFNVETHIKEFTVAGEVHQIKSIKLTEPEKTQALLTALARKHVDFKVIRILMPGTIVTMEYREDRINFQFDEDGLPKSVSRG